MFLEMFEDEFAHEKVSPSLSPPSLSQMQCLHKIFVSKPQQCTNCEHFNVLYSLKI